MHATSQPLNHLAVAVEALRVQLLHSPSTEGIVSDMLGSTFARAKAAFEGAFSFAKEPPVATVDTLETVEAYRHLRPGDYPLLARQPHQTMEGFTGKYPAYSAVVERGLDYYHEELNTALTFYRILVGSLLTNRSSRAGWQDFTDTFEKSARKRAAQDDSQAAYWGKGSHTSVVTVGDVVSRLSDLTQLASDKSAIAKRLAGIDVAAIKARTTEIGSLVVMLSKGIEKKEYADITKAQIFNLATGIMELAYQCEHFSVAVYRAHMYQSALARLEATVVSFK